MSITILSAMQDFIMEKEVKFALFTWRNFGDFIMYVDVYIWLPYITMF